MTALISIVIPTFNRASTLPDAVRSAFGQTHSDVETIVVDDGSTDETPQVLKVLVKTYGPSLRVIVQKNAGASAARNAGLEAARGNFIQFLDSDDILHPEKLALQLALFRATPDADVVFCHGTMETSEGDIEICPNLGQLPERYLSALCGREVHIVPTLAPLWPRAFLDLEHYWNPDINLGDDLEFHVRCLADLQRVAFVSRRLFTVRSHSGDRLSDFSKDDGRLASLLVTRKAVFESMNQRGIWQEECAQNAAVAMRSLYLNFLLRMPNSEIEHFEDVAARMAGDGPDAIILRVLFLTRRLLGRKAALLFANWGGGHAARLARLRPGRIARALEQRLRWVAQIRPMDAIRSVRNVARPELQDPEPGTALLVEPNAYHAETLPGYVSLLAAAGFRTTILGRTTADIEGAISRLPADRTPAVSKATLSGIRSYLRSPAPSRFDLVFYNSNMIAEPYGYYGSILNYVGSLPSGKRGSVLIEHSLRELRYRGDWLRKDGSRFFALRDLKLEDVELPMLAPVDLGRYRRADHGSPLRFVVVGRLAPEQRNIADLISALEVLLSEDHPPFEVHVVGSGTQIVFPESLRSVIRLYGPLPFIEMYKVVEKAHVLLPLLDSRIDSHLYYLEAATSGSRQLILGLQKASVWEAPFADAYGFCEKSAVVHETGRLLDGLREALHMSPDGYSRMIDAVGELCANTSDASVKNLRGALRIEVGHS